MCFERYCLGHKRISSCLQVNNIKVFDLTGDQSTIFFDNREKLRMLISYLRGGFSKTIGTVF
jgi:hypothetical protein